LGVCLGGWSPAGMHVLAHALWQQRCLEVASRLHHVGVVDETRRTYRHHGWQRDAPWRIATFRHATQRVAPHRYATLEPLGKPGGSRAFSAGGPPQAPVAPRGSCEGKYMRAEAQIYGIMAHLSVNKDAPSPRTVHSVSRILPTPFLGGLHHLYVRV
jgi:hypothetical protein